MSDKVLMDKVRVALDEKPHGPNGKGWTALEMASYLTQKYGTIHLFPDVHKCMIEWLGPP